jgi:hypothetical protein
MHLQKVRRSQFSSSDLFDLGDRRTIEAKLARGARLARSERARQPALGNAKTGSNQQRERHGQEYVLPI